MKIILLISLILVDIIKFPFFICILPPMSALFAIIDAINGEKDCFKTWIGFNIELMCFTYSFRDYWEK